MAAALGDPLAALLPGAASASAMVSIADADLNALSTTERELLSRCVPARRREFAAGRAAARQALGALGIQAPTIGRGHRGQPLWPHGVTGSISHAAGVAAAVVTRRCPAAESIGVDIEAVGAVDTDIWSHVFTAAERRWLASTSEPAIVSTMAFSAKEAGFKALYPLAETEIEFMAATVTPAGGGRGSITVDGDALGAVRDIDLRVEWAIHEGIVIAIAVLPANVVSPPMWASARSA